jgi:putative two-component system response regulator
MMNLDQNLFEAEILIVDDERPNILLLERLLKASGYSHIRGTDDPRRVQDLLGERDADLVLLDLRMPYMDGFQVMEQIHSSVEVGDDYLPVLMLTAEHDPKIKLRALELGATDFLLKPFDRAEVASRVRNILQVRLLNKRVRQQNAELEFKVRERTRELDETRLEIIRRLGIAAEYRDNETGMHIVRMSLFAQAIALRHGLSSEQAELLLNAAPMHDIGKIGIPDRVLLKKDKLDTDEWHIMRSHTTIGAQMLSGHTSPLLQMAAEIALSHHERWDGSGYPQGLSGEAISLEARIVAVADVFDALLAERPYKKPWPEHEAIAEIQRLASKQFDPAVVESFLSALPELREIRARYRDS